MSEANDKMEERKEAMSETKTWQVEYSATYWVEATSEEEAIDLAIEEHSDLPNGDWSAFIEQKWGKS
jgi:hypothetical protein